MGSIQYTKRVNQSGCNCHYDVLQGKISYFQPFYRHDDFITSQLKFYNQIPGHYQLPCGEKVIKINI